MAAKMLTSKQNLWLRLVANHLIGANQSSVSLSTASEANAGRNQEVIKIPKRIERGPTDILRALAEVTERDMSGPPYQYLDDPFLTPMSNYQKRVFSLSRESGRKAAKYVFEEFPELFIRDMSEPKIDAFTYREIYDENTEVDETDLQKCVARKEVNHAIVCYKNLVRDSKPISADSLQKLLELVCFYNCDEPPDLEFVTEKTFVKPSETPRIMWLNNGFAEQLFEAMPEKTSASYCALIQGMCKHHQAHKAWEVYQQMVEKQLKPCVQTYNDLIGCAPILRDSIDSRWMFAEELLNSMKANGVKPNVRTMNALLEVISRFASNLRYIESLAKKVLVEMTNKLGIEPSLATYNHLLNIFYKDHINTSSALNEIIDKIEGKYFTIQDPKDVNFFINAMHMCMTRVIDPELAHRIHKLASNSTNSLFLVNVLAVQQFYQKYFKVLTTAEDIDKLMAIYLKHVPYVYIPEQSVLSDICGAIELYQAYRYLPRIYQDIKQFEYSNNVKFIEEFLGYLSRAVTEVDPQMQKQLSEMVTDSIQEIDKKIEAQFANEVLLHYQLTGKLVDYAIVVYLKTDELEKAIKLVDKMFTEPKKFLGSVSSESLFNLCQKAIEQNKLLIAKYCIERAVDLEMTETIHEIYHFVKESDSIDEKIKKSIEKLCLSRIGSSGDLIEESITQEMKKSQDFIEENSEDKK